MILLDAIYINNSGGKILLDYLIQELEKSEKKVFYLLDSRVEGKISYLNGSKNEVLLIQASLLNRYKFYLKNKNRFKSVLCFGNLPPNIRLNAVVYTYFHQQLYIHLPKDASLMLKVSFFLKRQLFKYFFSNTDYWFLQTDYIKTNFATKFNVDPEKVIVFPFYPKLIENPNVERIKHSYVYVSNAPPHKNHLRLINAFCSFYDKYHIGRLTLTIDYEFTDLLEIVKEKINLNYPIYNIGFVQRDKLSKIYRQSEYLIYPSTAESFGLGIIEAIENGCKVIGADLPYTYAVCKPSLTFDPLNEQSIFEALSLSLSENTSPSYAKISNKIEELISILK
ncbi:MULTISPECIES: glycosyltransferase [Chryseobacterium]|uniref:Glycosyltransferase, MSMEG_0565 family n=1 Tax=Chryseobacterium taihuense TaxID=1141221 RepID=A0A4U8WB23_9FLAO|nr:MULTISPECIES: glycosyltransferase [Chryseobacterium]QQV03382.1 glycosyltransferase [Chryseobacterium sp. FDAARGOS 1104]VFB03303.1 glycosyltransferase, MSMEG_0565 family [Chryseobacterium taihuense]